MRRACGEFHDAYGDRSVRLGAAADLGGRGWLAPTPAEAGYYRGGDYRRSGTMSAVRRGGAVVVRTAATTAVAATTAAAAATTVIAVRAAALRVAYGGGVRLSRLLRRRGYRDRLLRRRLSPRGYYGGGRGYYAAAIGPAYYGRGGYRTGVTVQSGYDADVRLLRRSGSSRGTAATTDSGDYRRRLQAAAIGGRLCRGGYYGGGGYGWDGGYGGLPDRLHPVRMDLVSRHELLNGRLARCD